MHNLQSSHHMDQLLNGVDILIGNFNVCINERYKNTNSVTPDVTLEIFNLVTEIDEKECKASKMVDSRHTVHGAYFHGKIDDNLIKDELAALKQKFREEQLLPGVCFLLTRCTSCMFHPRAA